MRAAQLANGAWPLTWRPGWLRWLSPSFEDWPSTNDAATAGPIEALLQGSAMLGNPEDLLAARRGGDWLLAIQGAPPQAGWAQQYDTAGRPAPGRRFEPAGFATWESREMLDALVSLARVTGERRYCRAVGPAVRWFFESALAPGCWARLYAPGANAPLFVDRDGRPVATPAEARQLVFVDRRLRHSRSSGDARSRKRRSPTRAGRTASARAPHRGPGRVPRRAADRSRARRRESSPPHRARGGAPPAPGAKPGVAVRR